ncbi:hypothetical protein A8F94_01250 [Bacillus sp. FJAT-27225]|uniref:SDR family NAD(P)-dependent oxidoreductase n=1 Tax=Bacillus sp. FJAT-27225 TaxID=1743144 RepID=UPI00080C2C4F|nr:SDR family oxidoreductase [Bacillus sp. FJAT-27225]OCA90540.1 hypothetical protein A8F94_01250 [Bacillus sp. FJAT-27225]
MGRLEGKVALITGAAQGQGLTEAQLFAKEGAKVVALDLKIDVLQEEANKIIADGGDAIALKLDVWSEENWKEVIAKAIEKYGKIDVLVNNAAIFFGKSIKDAELSDWNKIMGVNATGTFLGMKYVAPEMAKNGKGSIINISSMGALAGGVADGFDISYSASKGAIRSMTKHAANVLAQDNIRVNTVFPGPISTPMTEESFKRPEAKAVLDRVKLAPHFGETLDIAYGVLYLASDESKFTTGGELLIDGGYFV